MNNTKKSRTIMHLTRAETLDFFNRCRHKDTRFLVSVLGDAPSGEDFTLPVSFSVCLPISRDQAEKLVQSMISEGTESRGGRIKVWVWEDEPNNIWFGN